LPKGAGKCDRPADYKSAIQQNTILRYAFGLTSTIADPEPPATFQNHVAQEELKLLWLQLGRTNPTPTESLNDQTEKLGTEK
jgi:hypothetical protein